MTVSVRTNLASMDAMQAHRSNSRSLKDTFRKLSSGFRIERAADDSAGLAVSENLKARIGSQRVAHRNTNDGISVVQTAEGALNEVGDMMKRMRELAVQGSSETLADSERAYLNDEFKQLQQEIGRIKEVTEFNGSKLVDGSLSSGMKVQVGAYDSADDRIAITVGDVTQVSSSGGAGGAASVTSGNVGVTVSDLKVGDISGSSFTTISPPLTSESTSHKMYRQTSAIARANAVNAGTGTHGVSATAQDTTLTIGGTISAGTYAASNSIFIMGASSGGTGMMSSGGTSGVHEMTPASDVTVLAGDSDGALQTAMQASLDAGYGTGVLTADTSSGALEIKAADGRGLGFRTVAVTKDMSKVLGMTTSMGTATGTVTFNSSSDFELQASGGDWGLGTGLVSVSAGGGGGGGAALDITSQAAVNVSSVANAQAALTVMDQGIDYVNRQRSGLGAVQNRLQIAMNNLETGNENLSAANSRIKDADFAFETAKMAQSQILQQAGTAVMGQANQLPQMALRLI